MGRAEYGTILTVGYCFFSASAMAGRVTSALNERFHTRQTVLPASVSSLGAMAAVLTVLSPRGLTTLYTGSADGFDGAVSCPTANCIGCSRRLDCRATPMRTAV